jgi:hypothetical protein
LTDHGVVDIDVDDYQAVKPQSLPIRARTARHDLANDAR